MKTQKIGVEESLQWKRGARLVACIVLITAGGMMAAGRPVSCCVNVTSVVHDENAAPNDLLLRSDDYNKPVDSWQASYSSVNNVTSQIGLSGGAWQLLLGNQSVRRVWLTLSKPVNNSRPAPVPDGSYYDSVEVYARCFDANNNETGLLVIPPGMSNNRCTFGVDFAYNRTKYKFVMGPVLNFSGAVQGTTGWATVSCNTATGTVCSSWTITPYMIAGNGNVPTVAALYQYGKNGSLSYVGSYYNTYHIDVTNS